MTAIEELPPSAWVEFTWVKRDFRRFLPYWHFTNRETGQIMTYREPETPCFAGMSCSCIGAGLWPGQRDLADVMQSKRWVFALKAGKLGFTELENAFDGFRMLTAHENARVHLFSKDDDAAKALLEYVKFGLRKLPAEWGVQTMERMAGGSTMKSLIMRHRWCGPEDKRSAWSYPATGNAAIDQSCCHSHVDELSHMANADRLWNSVITTIEPGGTCHIVTRGAGDQQYSAELWAAAVAAPVEQRGQNTVLYPHFAPFDRRPDRTEDTRRALEESGSYTQLGLSYFQPRTPEEALAGDESSPYISLELWDQLGHELGPLRDGDRTPLVLAADAAVWNDCFALVGGARHPDRPKTDVALRLSQIWKPQDFVTKEHPKGRIELATIEERIRWLCKGGCRLGHPSPRWALGKRPKDGCALCDREEWTFKGLNVVEFTYDPHGMEDMTQRFAADKVVKTRAFAQGEERLIGDALMFRMANQGTLSHHGDATLREHIGNSKAETSKVNDSRMRIIKKSPSRKIDGAVAAAMCVKRVLDLPLSPADIAVGSLTRQSRWRS